MAASAATGPDASSSDARCRCPLAFFAVVTEVLENVVDVPRDDPSRRGDADIGAVIGWLHALGDATGGRPETIVNGWD